YGIQREQGWVALLEDTLKPLGGEHRVINASISGDTTGGGAARLPAALEQHQPDLGIIELGGNDGLRGYPVPRLRDNLSTMIEASIDADAQVLLVGMQIPPNYGPRYTQAFAGTFTDLANEYDVALIPGFLEQVALAGGLMQADGIHPTAAAQPLLLQAAWPAIAAFLQSHKN
ncbi:MAG: arylesterase, partial [Pseudomonadales bacterium]